MGKLKSNTCGVTVDSGRKGELSHKQRRKISRIPTILWGVVVECTVHPYHISCCQSRKLFKSFSSFKKTSYIAYLKWTSSMCIMRPSFSLLALSHFIKSPQDFLFRRTWSHSQKYFVWWEPKEEMGGPFFWSGRYQVAQMQQVVAGKRHLCALFSPDQGIVCIKWNCRLIWDHQRSRLPWVCHLDSSTSMSCYSTHSELYHCHCLVPGRGVSRPVFW